MTIGRWNVALLVVAAGICSGTPAAAQITGKLVNPNVLLVIDSSRSMDWLQQYSYPPPGAMARELQAKDACEDGSPLRSSWQQLLDVMLGSIPSGTFQCFVEQPEIRPALQYDTLSSTPNTAANTDEYWSAASPHFRGVSCDSADWNTNYEGGQCIGPDDEIAGLGTVMATGHWCQNWIDYDGDLEEDPVEDNYLSAAEAGRELCFNYHPRSKARLANGLLERYRTLARFGVMTYDNKPSPLSVEDDPHEGWFDYGESRKWNCKKWAGLPGLATDGCTWNAGARAMDENAVGRLVQFSDDLEASNKKARDVFATTEPLYCSPIGALLDDVGYFFGNEASARPAGGGGSDLFYNCRPKLVIFISDGQPNQDFEFPQDYCAANPPHAPGETAPPSTTPYACPWNSSAREVEEFREVIENLTPTTATENMDPVYFVVIGFNTFDKDDVVCDPEWNPLTNECEFNEWCIQVESITSEAQCQCDTSDLDDCPFRTPRQFLNELALTGWPTEDNPLYPIQPPWRLAETDSGYSDICDDEEEEDEDSCGGETGDGEANGAVFVDGPDELAGVLDLILSTFISTTATRTEVVTTNQVAGGSEDEWSDFVEENESGTNVAQYEFNSGFQVVGGKPWKGYLYRQGYACAEVETGTDTEQPPDQREEFHNWLNGQSGRHIYSVPDAKLVEIAESLDEKYNYTNFLEGMPKGTLQLIDPSSTMTDCDVGGPTEGASTGYEGICSAHKDILTALKKHLYGETGSLRAEHKLADIYNSTPAILGPPLERITLASYQGFQLLTYMPTLGGSAGGSKQQSARPPFLYVGTNDGVLHSFDVWSGGDNVETWGYVPNALLGSIARQFPISTKLEQDAVSGDWDYTIEESGMYQHIFGVDGSPVAADVRLFRMPSGAALPDSPQNWRSVVVGGLGKGGAGYYALDVTNPEDEPRFRWEISERFSGNNDPDVFRDGGKLVFGMSIGKPALTYVYISGALPAAGGDSDSDTDADTDADSDSETAHEVAVAILPGGYKNDENNGPETSTGVAIVRVGDGKLIRYLNPALAGDLCGTSPTVTPAQLVGEPAVPYPLRALTVNDEAFIGDDRGRLWRIDMSSKNAGSWCLEMFFDTLLTHHYPYQDCIAGACCGGVNDGIHACDPTDIEMHASDDQWDSDACTGQACPSTGYPYPRIPIINAPTIVQDENRNNIILFGTGEIDGVESFGRHRIFSLTQRISYNITKPGETVLASTSGEDVTINWWLGAPIPSSDTGTDADTDTDAEPEDDADIAAKEAEMTAKEISFSLGDTDPDTLTSYPSPFDQGLFNHGEKLLGRISVFNEVAYFTTFIPALIGSGTVDACESGASRIWGVNFGANPSAGAWTGSAFGRLGGKVFEEFQNDLLSGVKVVRRPSCTGQASYQLVAQRANDATTSGGGDDDATTPRVSSLSLTIPQTSRGFTNVSIDSWSLVFN